MSFSELKIYGITRGLHPPWNWGEAVVTRNIFLVLRKFISANIKIYSMLDRNRFSDEELSNETVPALNVEYVNSPNIFAYEIWSSLNIMKDLLVVTEENDKAFIHLIGIREIIPWIVLSLLKRLRQVYKKVHFIVHNYGPIPQNMEVLPYETRLLLKTKFGTLITTSLITYKTILNSKRAIYIPAPYIPASELEYPARCTKSKGCIKLNELITDFKGRLLLYVGPLREERFPHSLVLRTLRKLISAGHRNIMLLIVSPESRYNLESAFTIMRLANELQIADYVQIIVGYICEYCKEKMFKSSTIFLFLPTRKRQSMDPPISVLEAMAHGNVIIASNYLSLHYMLKSERNGILLNNVSLESLASAISKTLADDKYYEQISNNAINYIRNNHYYPVVASRLSRPYKELVTN